MARGLGPAQVTVSECGKILDDPGRETPDLVSLYPVEEDWIVNIDEHHPGPELAAKGPWFGRANGESKHERE